MNGDSNIGTADGKIMIGDVSVPVLERPLKLIWMNCQVIRGPCLLEESGESLENKLG